MLKDLNIILFTDDEWGGAYQKSKHHLAKRLARHNSVLWVNSIGLRRPSASGRDLRRISQKLRLFGQGLVSVGPKLSVFSPIAIPLHGNPAVDALNAWLLRLQLRRCLKQLGWSRFQAWVFLPTAGAAARALRPDRLIYYCTDEFTAFAGVDSASVARMESELMRAADTVFVTSRGLEKAKAIQHPRTRYLPHGVDVDLFARALDRDGVPPPPDIAGIAPPILGFYGLMTREWVDFPLLEFVARARQEWSLVLIGTTGDGSDALLGLPNVHFLGAKCYDDLYRYSAHFDVALLPFVSSELTLNSNPLKIREYLAAGLPVVSLKLPELAEFSEWIEFAENREDFLRGCEAALTRRSAALAAARRSAVADASWEARLEQIARELVLP